MPIKDLKIDLSKHRAHVSVTGRRDILSASVEGNWATVFKGRGMEFTGYRQYTYTDDASLIDWKASLRSKEILVREFEEFKNFEVLFLFDVSNTMLFSSVDQLKVEYAAELLFVLAQAASHTGDAIGLAMYSNRILASFQPEFGRGIRLKFERLLSDKENYGGERNLKRSLLEVSSMLQKPSLIIMISDFLDFPDDWERYFAFLANRHQLIGIMVKDKRDRELPNKHEQFYLKDPNGKEVMYVDTKQFAKEYKRLALEHEARVSGLFKKMRSSCLILENGTPFEDALQKFFNSQVSNIT